MPLLVNGFRFPPPTNTQIAVIDATHSYQMLETFLCTCPVILFPLIRIEINSDNVLHTTLIDDTEPHAVLTE